MCGIAGYYGKGSLNALTAGLDTIKHRGPDDRGVELFDHVGLGHNRLSIIDLSPLGHQPMYNRDKTACIVFNGEIYNFLELRKELEPQYSFVSQSDTEVMLAAYDKWGFECVKHFNGMFSFVIYDRQKDLLFGARDKVGEKPLKYCQIGDSFYFASEVKAVLKLASIKPEMDPLAIHHYLTLMYVPAPLTGFKAIRKLPPAHYFVFQNGKLELTRYWELDYSKKLALSPIELEEELLHKLEAAVKLRMISDVPIGALLSGGVDSSAVVAYMAKNSKERVKTFCIGFDDAAFNETHYAQIVADKYNTEHTVLPLPTYNMAEVIGRATNFYDEPFADNSLVPTFLVSELAKQQVTVALNGDGGDENFGGYERYNWVALGTQLRKSPQALVSMLKETVSILGDAYSSKQLERGLRFLTSLRDEFSNGYQNYNCFFTEEAKKRIYADSQAATSNINQSSFGLFSAVYKHEWDDLDKAFKIDISSYLPECLLYKTDIAAMAFGLELRAPLLDPTFMEFVSTIPAENKVDLIHKKIIFKHALVKNGILPKEVVYRKKRGFNAPLGKWLRTAGKGYVYETILAGDLQKTELFDMEQTKNYIDSFYASRGVSEHTIFALTMLSEWLRTYIYNN